MRVKMGLLLKKNTVAELRRESVVYRNPAFGSRSSCLKKCHLNRTLTAWARYDHDCLHAVFVGLLYFRKAFGRITKVIQMYPHFIHHAEIQTAHLPIRIS